jgi:hypothetical protein
MWPMNGIPFLGGISGGSEAAGFLCLQYTTHIASTKTVEKMVHLFNSPSIWRKAIFKDESPGDEKTMVVETVS